MAVGTWSNPYGAQQFATWSNPYGALGGGQPSTGDLTMFGGPPASTSPAAGTSTGTGGNNMLGAIAGAAITGYFGLQAARAQAQAGLAAAKAADWRAEQSIYANRDTAKFALGAQIYNNHFQERRANKDLLRQKDAARWNAEILAPISNNAQIDLFEKQVNAESSPGATRLRKEKKREDFASRMLTANAQLSGMFGPTSQDQMYRSHLGMFG